MEQIDYMQLGCSISAIQSILEFEMEERKNSHVIMHLRGVMQQEDDTYVTSAKENEIVQVFIQTTGDIIFQGIIQQAEIYMYGGLRYLDVRCVSCSYYLDIQKKRRSFQDLGMSYKTLINQIVKEYNGGAILDFCSNGNVLGQLWVQYDETDWEFLKRMASHFNHAVYAEPKFNSPKIYFGKRKGKSIGELTNFNYRIKKDIGSYMVKKYNTVPQLSEQDSLMYQIQTKELYEIGDEVSYQEQKLYIYEKKIVMKDSILECFYTLGKENAFLTEFIFQDSLAGKAVCGTVLERVKEKIKVHLSIDDNQEKDKAYLFPYATVYAAEGHSGWYCMPEEGDTVNVNFPTKMEADAVAMECVRAHPGPGDKISDPNTKYFSTPYGKEIMMTPEQIKITCLGGDKKNKNKCIYISLNEGSGVTISSTENVQFKADKSITLDAGGSINISAGDELNLRCKTGEILMNSRVEVNGDDVRIN